LSDVLTKYYEKAFEKAGEGGSIYMPMSVMESAGHNRKAEILEALEIPGLSEAVVVDYGVGSWGFGCVFPKLKQGKVAVGIDISGYAVECSRKIAESDPDLIGKEVRFFTSSGYDIKMENESADIVFAGECIEHIEDTDAFLSEIWRILKPGGTAIFTTPNERPYLYRQMGLSWAMGFEHVALMDADELLFEIRKFFDVTATKRYTSSLGPNVDSLVEDPKYAADIAHLSEDDFDKASGLIVQARKRDNDQRSLESVSHQIVECDGAVCSPSFDELSLFEDAMGRTPTGANAEIRVPVPPHVTRCQLIMWSHPWSGIARIETASGAKEIDLYSHVSGCKRIRLDAQDLAGLTSIRIIPTGNKADRSKGVQVIFFRAVFSVSNQNAINLRG
jgi:SAM-dependent methyltransferase